MKKMMRIAVAVIWIYSSLCFVINGIATAGSSSSVAYQINPAHTGFINMPSFSPPLKLRWTANLGKGISYPIVADGKVFVTVTNPSWYGTNLYALDGKSGRVLWGPVALGGHFWWSNCCYEAGRVFAVNFDGLLRAFDANTGDIIWSTQLLGNCYFSAPPTVYNGVVYVGGAGNSGKVYAVNSESGAILWSAFVSGGYNSSPAVTNDGVYVSYACARSYKFDPLSGNLLWSSTVYCYGGGGKTSVYYNGYLYSRDTYNSNYIFVASTGSSVGNFLSMYVPAFSNNIGILSKYHDSVKAYYNVIENNLVWSFSGDGNLCTAPIIINKEVYVGSSKGNIYAVNKYTGEQEWTANVGALMPDASVTETNIDQPLTGLGAGDGIIVIPTATTLVAYEAESAQVEEPVLIEPDDGAEISNNYQVPTFKWKPNSCIKFRVVFSSTPDFRKQVKFKSDNNGMISEFNPNTHEWAKITALGSQVFWRVYGSDVFKNNFSSKISSLFIDHGF